MWEGRWKILPQSWIDIQMTSSYNSKILKCIKRSKFVYSNINYIIFMIKCLIFNHKMILYKYLIIKYLKLNVYIYIFSIYVSSPFLWIMYIWMRPHIILKSNHAHKFNWCSVIKCSSWNIDYLCENDKFPLLKLKITFFHLSSRIVGEFH